MQKRVNTAGLRLLFLESPVAGSALGWLRELGLGDASHHSVKDERLTLPELFVQTVWLC